MAENPYAKCGSCGGLTIDRCCVASRTVEVVMGDLVIAWDDGHADGYDEGLTASAAATADAIKRAVDSAKPQWRPIPDEAPEDGWYWVRHRDGKIGVRDIFDGQVYQGGGDYAHEWGCAGATHIAGPIEPPEGE